MPAAINYQQVQLYMNAKDLGQAQATAAAQAGISARTTRRLESGTHRPQRGRPRNWQTRAAPLAGQWETQLQPMFERAPRLEPTTLFEVLQEAYPGASDDQRSTVQRRVEQWKVRHGKPKEVMFKSQHQPGAQGLSALTHLKGVTVTVAGKPFQHMLYPYRLASSGWQDVQVMQGGKRFVGLSQGLQNALQACGGVPQTPRTDSLSAAYRKTGDRNPPLTQMAAAIGDHYRMRPTRNNPGVAHENGSIEASPGYCKRRLGQALYWRGSFAFQTAVQDQTFIATVLAKLNAKCQQKREEERPTLQALPRYRTADDEVLSSRVSAYSTVSGRCLLYSVPSRLLGQRLTLPLYQDRLAGFVGSTKVVERPQLHMHGSQAMPR